VNTIYRQWSIKVWTGGVKVIVIAVLAIWGLSIATIHNLAIVVGGGVAVVVVLRLFGAALGLVFRSSRRALSRAPAGSRLSGRGYVSCQRTSIHSQARWAEWNQASSGRSLPVQVEVTEKHLLLRPKRRLPPSALVTIGWQEVADLRSSLNPGKAIAGTALLALTDGSSIRFSVQDYRSFSEALMTIRDGLN